MKARFGLALVAFLAVARTATAQQPIDPYAPAAAPAPIGVQAQVIDPYSQSQAGVVAPPPLPPPPSPPPPPSAYPQGYNAAPPMPPPCGCCPQAYAAPCPSCCPQRCPYPPPAYPPYPPPPYPPYPPPIYRPRYVPPLVAPRLAVTRPRPQWDGVRRFSIGAHVTVLGINQQIGSNRMTLGGAGLQLRFRSQGRFGFELNQSFLYANYEHDNFVRKSYPLQASLLFYLFPNQDSRHFNIYALAGAGVVFDTLRLLNEFNYLTQQSFVEWEGHVGLGLELRWRWFAIAADARALGLLRDNSNTPAAFYNGVSGGPVPARSWGIMGNAYVSFWF